MVSYYRRAVFDQVCGLDENYWPSWIEDDDFCQAARFHGHKVFVLPEVKAIHHAPSIPPMVTPFFSDTSFIHEQLNRLKSESISRHYTYWEKKWGWNPLHPDLNEIRRLYGETEICWRIGEPMRYKKTAESLPGLFRSLLLSKRSFGAAYCAHLQLIANPIQSVTNLPGWLLPI